MPKQHVIHKHYHTEIYSLMQKTTGKKKNIVHARVNLNILGYFASITSLA